MRKFFRRLSAFLQRRRLRQELAEEMAAHREMMPPDRQRNFGNTLRLQEEAADEWGWTIVEQFRQDAVYGMRSLLRSPGFTLTALAVLAIGIGVNLAEIHLLQAQRHRIHVRDIDSLTQLLRVTTDGARGSFSVPAIEFYGRYNTTFSSVIAETRVQGVFQAGDSDRLHCGLVSGNYFRELGITPLYGRMLDGEDEKAGSPPVAVLGHAYWQSRFGGDPSIVQKMIRLNDKPVQVVGIAPPEFGGLIDLPTPVWMPISQYGYLTRDSSLMTDYATRRTSMFGRIKPGVSLEVAEAELRSLTGSLRNVQPRYVDRNEWIKVQPADTTPNPPPGALLFFTICILLILLVLFSACANLGNMLLARGLAPHREIEIRLAIGAGRWRLIRQLMTENLLLALLASIAALFVGRWTARILLLIINAPHLQIVTDWKIVLACAALGLAATLGFGLAPAFQAVKGGARAGRIRKILVSVQVAVSCVLLILSSLFTRGIEQSFRTDVRFDYAAITVVNPEFYLHGYSPAQARQAALEIAASLRQLPGIDSVTISSFPPLTRRLWLEHVSGQDLYMNAVDTSYFPLMRLPLLQGHIFGPGEPDAIVISESAARRLWSNESPLGKDFVIGERKWIVTGIVKDSGANIINHPESVEVYTPIADKDAALAMILVHAARNRGSSVGAIRSAATLSGMIPQVDTLQSFIDARVDTIEKAVTVVASLGAIASLLAVIGIFGLLSFTVAQRTREIGVRLALGARTFHVLRAMLGDYTLSFGIGATFGIAVAVAAGTFLRNMIFNFLPLDLVSFAAGLLLFAALTLAAALLPAWRALRIDPASALRYE